MSLLTNKLSALKRGDYVRFTHLSGQIIEGIVTENDGTESLSIQVTSLSTIRYDQISLMEQSRQPDTPVSVIAQSEAPAVKIMKVVCTKETVSRAFKAMEQEEKKVLTQAYDKFQSFLKSHEKEK